VSMPIQAVILAGGKGTRLQQISGDLPKPLVPIDGKPVLIHQLDCLARNGLARVLILAGYGSDAIAQTIGHRFGDLEINYFVEERPKGTAGALLGAYSKLDESFFVLYGDTILNIDLQRMWHFHSLRQSDVTIMVHANSHPYDSDIVEFDEAGKIARFHGYPHVDGLFLPNSVSAALYAVEKSALTEVANESQVGALGASRTRDICKDLFPELLRMGKKIYAYESREYIKDMGTPDRFDAVGRDIASGRVESGSLAAPAPAVFWDRDGTITSQREYVRSHEELRVIDGAAGALRKVHDAGFLNVLVTNQPVLARGEVSYAEFAVIQNKLATELGRDRAYFDRMYFCPHHPDKGFAGEVASLKIDCNCRKPSIGMLARAKTDLNVDLLSSWFVGDSSTDLRTAENAGMHSILVRTGERGLDQKWPYAPTFECLNAADAARFIVETYPALQHRALEFSSQLSGYPLIFMGGLARSGKSSLALCVAQLFSNQLGLPTSVIPLDGWIKEPSSRGSTVIERYDLDAASAFITRYLAADVGTEFLIPSYDRLSRAPVEGVVRITRRPKTIIEGVVALKLAEQLSSPSCRVHVGMLPEARRDRFWADYRGRGLSEREIFDLFESREADEAPVIKALGKSADVVVEVS
jgi:D,D-heptose 1,7-bisphosphate phosphatase